MACLNFSRSSALSMASRLAPIIRMLLMSVRLGTPALLHHLDESIEQIAHVVRAGARFGVSLETERGPVGAREALQAAVEERHVGGLKVRRERIRIHREAV